MPWRILIKLGQALNPSAATQKVQEKTDRYLDRKREELVVHARTEAERFVAEQMIVIEAKVDEKLDEIERRLDALIEKEVRNKLRILIYTLAAVIGMSLISLGYLYLKRRMGL